MPQEGRAASQGRRQLSRVMARDVVDQRIGQERRARALAAVADQGNGRQIASPGAQHIGRADIARSDVPDIPCAAQPRGQHAEWDRAQQIAADQGRRDEKWCESAHGVSSHG